MNKKFKLIMCPADEGKISITKEISFDCPEGKSYLLVDNMDVRSVWGLINARDKEIAKYENLLRGLNYWKAEAMRLRKKSLSK